MGEQLTIAEVDEAIKGTEVSKEQAAENNGVFINWVGPEQLSFPEVDEALDGFAIDQQAAALARIQEIEATFAEWGDSVGPDDSRRRALSLEHYELTSVAEQLSAYLIRRGLMDDELAAEG